MFQPAPKFTLSYRSSGISTVSTCFNKDTEKPQATTPKRCQFLDLSNNSFTGTAPSSFTGLSNFISLQSLSLQNNALRGAWGDELLRHLPPALKRLDIGGNNIAHVPWKQLGQMKLLDLNLDNNSITALINPSHDIQELQQLPLFTSLRALSLAHNQLIHLQGLEFFSNLDAVDLRSNAIARTTDLQPLASLSKLQSLKIHSNNPCCSGDVCVKDQGCWRGIVLLKHCPKVVLLDSVRISPIVENRRGWVNKTTCPCNLEWTKSGTSITTTLKDLMEPATPTPPKPKTQAKNNRNQKEDLSVGMNVGTTTKEEEPEEEPEKEHEQEQVTANAQLEFATAEKPNQTIDLVQAVPNDNVVPEIPETKPTAQPIALVQKKVRVPHRPPATKATRTSIFNTKPAPRKKKKQSPLVMARQVSMLKKNVQVLPFGERKTTPKYAAMPFRKLGESRVAKPVNISQKGMWSSKTAVANGTSNWLTELLATNRNNKKRG